MKCKDIEKLIPLYAEHMLDAKVREKVEEHLKHCSHCRELVDIEKRITEDLTDFLNFQLEEMEIKSPAKRKPFFKFTALAAASLIAAFAFFFFATLNKEKGRPIEVKEIVYSKPRIKDIVFIDKKANTKVNKIGRNIYVIEITRR